MPTRATRAGPDRLQQAGFLLAFDPGHRPNRHHQVDVRHECVVGEGVEAVADRDVVPLGTEKLGADTRRLLRFVARPSHPK